MQRRSQRSNTYEPVSGRLDERGGRYGLPFSFLQVNDTGWKDERVAAGDSNDTGNEVALRASCIGLIDSMEVRAASRSLPRTVSMLNQWNEIIAALTISSDVDPLVSSR